MPCCERLRNFNLGLSLKGTKPVDLGNYFLRSIEEELVFSASYFEYFFCFIRDIKYNKFNEAFFYGKSNRLFFLEEATSSSPYSFLIEGP